VLGCIDPTCGDDEMPRPGELMAPRRHRRRIAIYSLASRRQVLTLSEQAGAVTVEVTPGAVSINGAGCAERLTLPR